MNVIHKPTFIVTTSNQRYGVDERLAEACRNAKLEEQSVAEDTCREIQWAFEWESNVDWGEVEQAAKDAMTPDRYPEKVEILIHYCDPRFWEGWSIDHIDGAITFHGYRGEESGGAEAMQRATVSAYWCNGRITPRIPTAKAA